MEDEPIDGYYSRKRSRRKMKAESIYTATSSKSPPKRPTNAYLLYYKEACDQARRCGETADLHQVRKNWLELEKDVKDRYIEEAKKCSESYRREKNKVVQKGPSPTELETRCSPHKIKMLLTSFDERKKEFVQYIGFSRLLDLSCGTLRRNLCSELVKRFDPFKLTLKVHGQEVKLSHVDVGTILGLSTVGDEFSQSGCQEIVTQICNDLNIHVVKNDIPLNQLENDLKMEGVDEVEFQVKFVLFITGWLLCPTSKVTVPSKFLLSLHDTNSIRNCNWSKLVFDGMIDGIKDYKRQRRSGISGCVFFLMLYYLNILDINIPEVKINNTSHSPLKLWGDSEIHLVWQHIQEAGGLDSLQVQVLSNGDNREADLHTIKRDLNEIKTGLSSAREEIKSLKHIIMQSLGLGQEKIEQEEDVKDIHVILEEI